MRASDRRKKVWTESRRARFHSVHGRIHCPERGPTQCLDGSVRGNRWTNARLVRRAGLPFVRRNLGCFRVYRPGLVWLFSKSVQSDSGGNARRWANRHGIVTVALVAGIRDTSVVRLEVPEFYRLADGFPVAATDLFAFPQTN